MVLKACQNQQAVPESTNNFLTTNGNGLNGNSPQKKDYVLAEPPSKKQRIQEKITYEDLDVNDTQKEKQVVKLSLSRMERYLEGPVKAEWMRSEKEDAVPDVDTSMARLRELSKSWPLHYPNHGLIQAAPAVAALGELTPGGALMVHQHDESLAQLVSSSLKAEVQQLYSSSCELLRHFWACFPPTTPELQEKAEHMHNAIRRFHHNLVKPFENKVMLDFSPLSQQLTAHLNQLLTTAYTKYEMWQSRRKPLGLR